MKAIMSLSRIAQRIPLSPHSSPDPIQNSNPNLLSQEQAQTLPSQTLPSPWRPPRWLLLIGSLRLGPLRIRLPWTQVGLVGSWLRKVRLSPSLNIFRTNCKILFLTGAFAPVTAAFLHSICGSRNWDSAAGERGDLSLVQVMLGG